MTHLNWHTYGSGHLHGLSAPGLHLEIALEPDALHRETQRCLSLTTGSQRHPLVMERGYTATGQLEHLRLKSPHSAAEQHYRYDALGQLTFRSQEGHAQDQRMLLSALLSDAVGTPYQLPGRGINPVDCHGMEQVIDGLEAQKAYDQRELASATGHHC